LDEAERKGIALSSPFMKADLGFASGVYTGENLDVIAVG
jgi:hypothetical protein